MGCPEDPTLCVPFHVRRGSKGVTDGDADGPLSVDPSATVFHYAHCLFEGLKAYRDTDGKVTMFRPDMNMKRMNTTAERIAMPVRTSLAIECTERDLATHADFQRRGDGRASQATCQFRQELDPRPARLQSLPPSDNEYDSISSPRFYSHSSYVPVGTQPALGIAPPRQALLFVICSPVGPYYPQGFKPVALYGTTEFTRASPGGIGAYKLGANYAAGVAAHKAATEKGYVQNLWLHGPEHYITEVGTMNAFVVFKKSDGCASSLSLWLLLFSHAGLSVQRTSL